MTEIEKQIEGIQESIAIRLDEIRCLFIQGKNNEGLNLLGTTIHELKKDLYIPNDGEKKEIEKI